MSTVRQGLIVAIALSTVAFTGTAMAGKGGGGNALAPGQLGTSPGQVWKSERSDPSLAPGSALPPGQQFKQDAIPPGQTFGTPGNKIPGSLP